MALDAGATPYEVFFCPEQLAGPEAEALIARFGRPAASCCLSRPM